MKPAENTGRLIFCSAPAWQVLLVADLLEESRENGNDLFLSSSMGETSKKLSEKGHAVVAGNWEGLFSAEKMPSPVDRRLRESGFQDIVIICSNYDAEGYDKIISYSCGLGADRVGLIYPDMLYKSVLPDNANGSHTFASAGKSGMARSVDNMFYRERSYPEGLCDEPLWDEFGAILETTFLCNYECMHCPRNVAELDTSASIDPELFADFVGDERIRHITLLGLGESLMNPEFDKISKAIAKRAVPTAIVTNGSYVTREKLENLIDHDLTLVVSMDGAEEETFGHLRKPSQLSQIISNLRRIIKEHSNVKVVFNMVLSIDNYLAINKVVELAGEIGVKKVNMLNVLALEEQSSSCHWFSAPAEERLSAELDAQTRARQLGVELVGKPSRPSLGTCMSPWNQMYVAMNGDVYPCSFIYRIPSDNFDECFMNSISNVPLEAFRLGNLKKESLSNIWNGPKIREIRRILLDSQNDLQLDLDDYLRLREKQTGDNPLDYCRTCLNRWNCAC